MPRTRRTAPGSSTFNETGSSPRNSHATPGEGEELGVKGMALGLGALARICSVLFGTSATAFCSTLSAGLEIMLSTARYCIQIEKVGVCGVQIVCGQHFARVHAINEPRRAWACR